MKLGYQDEGREIKTIILTFSVPKSQNSNKEQKNSITAKANLKKATLRMKFEMNRPRAREGLL